MGEQALTPIPGNLAERALTWPQRGGQGNALASTNLLNQHLPGPWGRIRAAPGAAAASASSSGLLTELTWRRYVDRGADLGLCEIYPSEFWLHALTSANSYRGTQ